MQPQRAVQPSLAVRLFGGDPAHRLVLLRAAWPLAVGAELARRTQVLEIKGNTLRVRVPDAAWRKVLHGMQATLRARLRAVAGELAPSRLSFQEAPLGGQDSPADTHPAAGGPGTPRRERETPDREPTLPDALERAAAAIADPELRAAFARTAARALARAAEESASHRVRP